jgi:hypothetical protein
MSKLIREFLELFLGNNPEKTLPEKSSIEQIRRIWQVPGQQQFNKQT